MKIIHTSDWHIGQIFYEHDRTDEHEAFFKKLADIVRKERPDALLVSGDIFDSAMPSAQNQRLYTDSILGLMEACPGMTAVITAGNHDSGSRLETVRNLWEKAGVKVVGCLARDNGQARYSGHIFRIPSVSGNGEAAGYVIALPHIYKQNYPVCQNGDRQRELYRKLMETVDEVNSAGIMFQRTFSLRDAAMWRWDISTSPRHCMSAQGEMCQALLSGTAARHCR